MQSSYCASKRFLSLYFSVCLYIFSYSSFLLIGFSDILFTTASRTVLGPIQPPIQWVQEALSLGVKRLGREADHSPLSSAEVKVCVELYLHSPNTSSWRGAQLKEKHRDNFTFTFIFIYSFYMYISFSSSVLPFLILHANFSVASHVYVQGKSPFPILPCASDYSVFQYLFH
jgi:hypothetical protein